MLTILSQNQKKALREAYSNKVMSNASPSSSLTVWAGAELLLLQKYKPLDLRPKKTRAIRRALTPKQVLILH